MADSYPLSRLYLQVRKEDLPLYMSMLQSGIEIPTKTGTTIKKFLCNLRGITEEYLFQHVETIFLNNTPIDDLDQTIQHNPSVLALSSAMPGLAGAILRRNSIHSGLRTKITAHSQPEKTQQSLTVTLKLFNKIARDCGCDLFYEGITISTQKLMCFLKTHPTLLAHAHSITLDGMEIQAPQLTVLLKDTPSVIIQLEKDNE